MGKRSSSQICFLEEEFDVRGEICVFCWLVLLTIEKRLEEVHVPSFILHQGNMSRVSFMKVLGIKDRRFCYINC